jgi:DNA-binding NarL/FixJ family response regulator
MTERQTTTVLLVDDHPLIRKGLRVLLESEADIAVAGEAGDGEVAIDQVRTLSPDVVVMDITMPKLNGIDATRRILAEAPETRIIALSIHSGKHFVDDMLEAGAAGYVLKESVPEELVRAVHSVMRGEAFLSAPILGTVISGYRKPAAEATAPEATAVPEENAAAGSLLQTKLHRPAPPGDLVPRTRLLERLEAGRVRPLTLVSAPAGYGKSVLISSWLESRDWPSTWLSLDEDDSGLRQFLNYFVAAVQSAFADACEDTLSLG